MSRLRMTEGLSTEERALLSRRILKEVVDLAYNANLPKFYGMCLGFDRVASDVRAAIDEEQAKPLSVTDEMKDTERVVTMADLGRLGSPGVDPLGFRALAGLLANRDLAHRRKELGEAIGRMVDAGSEEERLTGMQGALDHLKSVASKTAEWARANGQPIAKVRLLASSRTYRSSDPDSSANVASVDLITLGRAGARGTMTDVGNANATPIPFLDLELPTQPLTAAGTRRATGRSTSEGFRA